MYILILIVVVVLLLVAPKAFMHPHNTGYAMEDVSSVRLVIRQLPYSEIACTAFNDDRFVKDLRSQAAVKKTRSECIVRMPRHEQIVVEHSANSSPKACLVGWFLKNFAEMFSMPGFDNRRKNPWRVKHHVGMSGAVDAHIEWVENGDTIRRSPAVHVSMNGKLNQTVRGWFGDLFHLLPALPDKSWACNFGEVGEDGFDIILLVAKDGGELQPQINKSNIFHIRVIFQRPVNPLDGWNIPEPTPEPTPEPAPDEEKIPSLRETEEKLNILEGKLAALKAELAKTEPTPEE